MSGRIPREFIDELVARSDIVEVIDSYVPLRKAGREYKACCPFHHEKSPSFHVSQSKQVYYCFGCGAGGNVLSFVMEFARLPFVEAIEELAGRAGLQVPYVQGEGETAAPAERLDDVYSALAQANRFYQQQLRRHPQAGRAVQYLKDRGLTGEIAAEFGLGYAPPGWDNLLNHLGNPQILNKAGLLVEKEQGGYYDRFRERVMFPIHDPRGRIIGFGGRVLGEGTPKYLNSPETPVFHKGQELYGLYFVRKQRPAPQRVLVVEGYMDVVALAQFGIRNAVATLGTATSGEHLGRLFRVVDEVVFCFDGDEAGQRAAWRALETVLPLLREGRQATFMFLPQGEDPDTLVRKVGADGFAEQMRQAVPLSEFLFRRLGQQADLASLDGRARLVELARPLLGELPPGPYRELMLARLSELSRMELTALRALQGETTPRPPSPATSAAPRRALRGPPSPARAALGLLVQNPRLAGQVQGLEQLAMLAEPDAVLLVELLEYAQNHPNMNTGALLEHWRDTETEAMLKELAMWEHGLPDAGVPAEFEGAIQRLYRFAQEQRLELLMAKAASDSPLTPQEKQELNALLQSVATMPTRH